jgi:hypothetical protein
MNIRIFDYHKNEDFGAEHIYTIIKGRKYSFIQMSFQWDDYSQFPYLAISFGNNRLMDILFCFMKFSFAFEMFGRNWTSWEKEDERTT